MHLHSLPPYLVILLEFRLELSLHVAQSVKILTSHLLMFVMAIGTLVVCVVGLFDFLVSLEDLGGGHFFELGQTFTAVSQGSKLF